MKNNYIIKGLAALTLAGMLAGCSSDYLDVAPSTDIAEDVAMSSPEGAALAVSGIFESMNKQYANLDWNGNCGEAFVNTVLDDAFGPDVVFGLWSNFSGWGNWTLLEGDRYYATMIGWTYYYTIISQSNKVITPLNKYDADYTPAEDGGEEADKIDFSTIEAEDLASLRFSLAQALTMRAHAYQKLLGLYGPRFEDSKNGEALTVPIRLDFAQGPNVPLAKYSELVKQIYTDLDRALKLYEASGIARPESQKYAVDANVAHGIYARAALINHDWALAQEHAAAARKGYTIMDADTYLSGFTYDCSDYIWHMDPKFETTYYWSWGSHYACNGGYLTAWDEGAGAINKDLYEATDPNDIRRLLYVTPDKINDIKGNLRNPLGLTSDDCWNPECVSGTFWRDLTGVGVGYEKNNDNANKPANGMYTVISWIISNYTNNANDKGFKGQLDNYTNDDNFFNYQTRSAKKVAGYVQIRKDLFVKNVKVQLGAQMKFWGLQPYGNFAYPWMRASEMALIEAEAYCELGNDSKAQSALGEVMKNRVSGYKCTKTGDALRQEIRVQRRMELFMEGHNFTDFKRWNVPVERKAWKANDPKSGWVIGFGVMPLKDPSACNGWRWTIPFSETQYNNAID